MEPDEALIDYKDLFLVRPYTGVRIYRLQDILDDDMLELYSVRQIKEGRMTRLSAATQLSDIDLAVHFSQVNKIK